MRLLRGLAGILAGTIMLAAGQAGVQAGELRTLEGALQYRERIALPDAAQLVVEARGSDGAFVGEARAATGGAQVPLPFSFSIPADAPVTLRAAIFVAGQPRWVSETVDVAADRQPAALGVIPLKAFTPLFFSASYRCGSLAVRSAVAGDNAITEIGSERFAMSRVATASGARYDVPGDDGTFLWTKDDAAFVSLRGERLPECLPVPPELPKPYVARGNEPGWKLVMDNGRLELTTNSGANRTEASQPSPGVEGGDFVFDIEAQGLRIGVSQALCHDDATGMPYPDTVTVETADSELRGCGGDTLDLLTGTEWVVADIGGKGVVDGTHVSLVFDASGRIAGRGGCNNFSGSFTVTGEGVAIGQTIATMKACPEALMAQERRYFDALAGVVRIDFDGTGALLLIGADEAASVKAQRN